MKKIITRLQSSWAGYTVALALLWAQFKGDVLDLLKAAYRYLWVAPLMLLAAAAWAGGLFIACVCGFLAGGPRGVRYVWDELG